MKTLLTLDYEIYFGRRTGTVERTLLEPTEAIASVAEARGARLVFFVDAGYLLRMRAERGKSAALAHEHDAVVRQLARLAGRGHELQLHIHPHWEDSRWDDGWRIDISRYALHSFSRAEIRDIVLRYTGVLREIGGRNAARAYRAGGWVIQPFERLRDALAAAGVAIDSTVYPGGRRAGPVQPYDFHAAPAKSRWRFHDDPLVEDPEGAFLEVPIASHRVAPDFYWRLALHRKLGGAHHRAWGDGEPIALEASELARKLLAPTTSVVSLDGYKASFLAAAAEDYRRRSLEDFVVIGHPKALSPYSLECLDQFLAGGRAGEPATFAAYA